MRVQQVRVRTAAERPHSAGHANAYGLYVRSGLRVTIVHRNHFGP